MVPQKTLEEYTTILLAENSRVPEGFHIVETPIRHSHEIPLDKNGNFRYRWGAGCDPQKKKLF